MSRRAVVAVGAVLALLAASATAADGQRRAYRNPTVGATLIYQVPGMHRASVRRGVVYRRVAGRALALDVYRPRRAPGRLLPAVLLGGSQADRAGRLSGQKVGWSQLIAASGMAAVAFDIRSPGGGATPEQPAEDVAAALAYVREHARRLGIDGDRLCTLGFSVATGPWHLWAAMRQRMEAIRCNAVYYAPLDFTGGGLEMTAERAAEFSALTYLRRDGPRTAPLLAVRAGRDRFREINRSIGRFVAEARTRTALVELQTHPRADHAFDVGGSGDARGRAIVRRTLGFFREHLLLPRPSRTLREDCLTAAEAARVVRFRAVDGTQLVGAVLGAGTKGVVLGHQGGRDAPGNLCAWLPYARHLAASGYLALAFDHRGFGSSALAAVRSRSERVDLDTMAAIDFVRSRGAARVVVAGASLGGAGALAAAAETADIQGVISFASPLRFGPIDATAASRRLRMPALFVSAEGDGGFASDARQLHDASSSSDRRLAIVPGTLHGAPVLDDPETRRLVDDWIAERLAR